MGVITYNGNAIIPGPFVNIVKTYEKTGDGKIIGSLFTLTVHGKVLPYKGSPNSSGNFWTFPGYPPDEINTVGDLQRLDSLLRKQEALRSLFAVEGQVFQIQPWDNGPIMYCNPRIRTPIVFAEGLWYEYIDYTIELEADVMYGLAASNEDHFAAFISTANEEWAIEPADEIARRYRITHNISAKGKRFYNSQGFLTAEAWQNAKNYVTPLLGLDTNMVAPSSNIVGLAQYSWYNYIRGERINKAEGTYSVSETWLGVSGNAPAVEDFSVSVQIEANQKATVSVRGTVQGLQVSNNTTGAVASDRYTNANNFYTGQVVPALFNRAQTYSAITLNPTQVGSSVEKNYYPGIISYTAQWDNRQSTSVPGAITETVTLSDDNPDDVFSQIFVLGRPLGPVLQPAGTVTAKVRTLSIEALMPISTYTTQSSKPNTDSLVTTFIPSPAFQVFVSKDITSWTPNTGRYSRNVMWTWE